MMKQLAIAVCLLCFCACEKCEKRIIPLDIEKRLGRLVLC